MSKKIVQLNEEVIKGEIKELVRGSVEETLNELLDAEAEKSLPKLPGTSEMSSARVTAAATTAAALPPLPEMSHSRCPNLKGSLLKPPSLSGTAAGRAAWRKPSSRCTWQAYPSDVWRTSRRPCGAAKSSLPPSANRTRKRMSTLRIGGTALCKADGIRMSTWMEFTCAAIGVESLKM